MWTVWDYVHLNGQFNIGEIFSIYYESILDTSGKGHLWFMYPLFGLLLGTPFLSKMLHHMNDKELKILWYVTLGFNFIDCILCTDLGINFRVTSWFMNGWPVYYIGGYYYRHVLSKQSALKWAILGLVCLTITVLGKIDVFTFLDRFEDATTFQPFYIIFCMSLFVLFNKAVKINSDKIGKVIVFISGYTYYIYMYHMRGIEYIVRKLSIETKSFGNWMIVLFGTFAVSLIASIVTKLCLKPVQKLLDKVIVIKDEA